MEEQELRNIVVATGPELLREGLVARTWGNISARVDDTHYLITRTISLRRAAWIMKS